MDSLLRPVSAERTAQRWRQAGFPHKGFWLRGLLLVGVLSLALLMQWLVAAQGTSNFDSDEAIFGLMARHILQGQIPTYFYGQQYLSSAEAVVAAGYISVFWGNLLAIRMGAITLFAIFFMLHGLLAYRLWGYRAALFSLLLLAVPGPYIIFWTSRIISNFSTMAISGTLALLMLFTRPAVLPRSYARAFIFGLVLVLGLWSHPMAIIYFGTVALLFVLQSPEWAALYRRLAGGVWRRIGAHLPTILAAVSLGMLGLASAAFFFDACELSSTAPLVQSGARAVLEFAIVLTLLLCLWISQRRRALALGSLCMLAGIAIGGIPIWRAWLFFGLAPATGSRPSCPSGIPERVGLLAKTILPALWGIPLNLANLPLPQMLLWIVFGILIIAGIAAFIWFERASLRAVVSLSPLTAGEARMALPGILLALPLFMALLSNSVFDVMSVRYLLICWHASAIVLGLALARLSQKNVFLATTVALVCTLQLISGGAAAGTVVRTRFGRYYSPAQVVAIDAFLTQRHVLVGYADYWLAYPLDFLTEEHVTIIPYNGVDRYGAYTEIGRHTSRVAFMFPNDALPAGSEQRATVAQAFEPFFSSERGGSVFLEVRNRVKAMRFIERREVAGWDIWIVADT